MKIIRSEVPPLRSSGLGAMLDCPVVTAALVVPQVAGQLLVTAGYTPSRMRSEAAFAMLCGVAPLPASSGKTMRHRLNRGGDRQANRALHLVVLGRMRLDPKTQAYVAKGTTQGHSKLEINRCLKRYLAREVFYPLASTPAAQQRAAP